MHEINGVLAKGWPVAAGSEHSRLFVGYRDDPTKPGGGLFIVKNSATGSRHHNATPANLGEPVATLYSTTLREINTEGKVVGFKKTERSILPSTKPNSIPRAAPMRGCLSFGSSVGSHPVNSSRPFFD
jgi:hypothetical protein